MKNIIEVDGLVKRYDSKFVLGPIQLNIPGGVIVGLIGKNGAGKTTLLKSILNIISADCGNVKIFGKDYKEEEASIKEDIGVVLDNMFLPEILFVKDIDSIMSGIYKRWDSDLYFQYLKDFDVSSDKQIKNLSKGMRKKLEIAVALSHHPKLLVLDEVTSGLDPVVREEVLDIFLNFISDEEHSILLSTHITSDLEHIADEIVFLHNGFIVLNESRDEIMDNYGILKCDEKFFQSIDSSDILSYKVNKYDYHVLVKDRDKMKSKYRDCILDKVSLEELMVLMIKGERVC